MIEVKVIPGARATSLVSVEGNRIKVRIHAPPEKGKANDELISFLSKILFIPKNRFTICFGLTGRTKRILVEGIDQKSLESQLITIAF